MAHVDLEEENLDEATSLVAVSGELDGTTTSELRRRVDAALAGGRTKIVVDLTGLTHMDSSGLAELISCHQRAQGLQGGLALVVPSTAVRRTLEIRGVNHLFTIVDSRADALAALNRD
jgi:anti-anti-sigma factor